MCVLCSDTVMVTLYFYVQTNSEFYLKSAEQQLNRFTKGMSDFSRDIHARTMVDPKKVCIMVLC